MIVFTKKKLTNQNQLDNKLIIAWISGIYDLITSTQFHLGFKFSHFLPFLSLEVHHILTKMMK